jgi:glycosyltransferase involved in cell wall biosynthesis
LPGITAIVTTFNEEANIGDCLDSLRFADEILVVDSFSEDGTVDIARQHEATVLVHEYLSPAAQKNWAIPHASHEWVLILDADERVTPELAEEIAGTLVSPKGDGYEMKRRNFFLGREIRYSGWQNDWVLRLFRREEGRYQGRQIHERLLVHGKVGRLRGALLHYPYRTMDDYRRKLERYAEWSAMDALREGRRVSRLYALLHPPLRFLKAYLLQGGFLEGRAGLTLSLLTARYAAAKDARIRELWRRAREEDGKR